MLCWYNTFNLPTIELQDFYSTDNSGSSQFKYGGVAPDRLRHSYSYGGHSIGIRLFEHPMRVIWLHFCQYTHIWTGNESLSNMRGSRG